MYKWLSALAISTCKYMHYMWKDQHTNNFFDNTSDNIYNPNVYGMFIYTVYSCSIVITFRNARITPKLKFSYCCFTVKQYTKYKRK